MSRPLPRFSRILLASALAFTPVASTAATQEASPDPVPMPYPLTNDAVGIPKPIPCIPIVKCLPKAAGTLQLGTSPGDSSGSGPGDIEVLAWTWGAVDSADPQEGGEVTKRGAGRASVSEITPTKKPDKSTPVLLSKRRPGTTIEPGKLEIPNLSAGAGTVTLLVSAGSCVQGAAYPVVTLRSEGTAYELHDVTVAECGPAVAAKGKKAQTQKLEYLKVEMKEILVSGF